MMTEMHFKMCLVALLLTVCDFSFATGSQDEPVSCEPLSITCVCGIGEHKTYVFKELETTLENSMNGEGSKCVAASDPHQECANISCHFTLNSSDSDSRGPGSDSDSPGSDSDSDSRGSDSDSDSRGPDSDSDSRGPGSVSDSDSPDFLSNFYPIEIYITPGELPEGHRYIREAAPCQLPPLRNAAIKCWKWPGWMTCDITCIYGHAFPAGKDSATKQTANCRNTENTWKPEQIQDCKPYLNCKAKLVKPGTLKCKEPTNAPAYCEISCLDYDDFQATTLQRYECSDETFGKKLPHCAVLKNDASIIRKPH